MITQQFNEQYEQSTPAKAAEIMATARKLPDDATAPEEQRRAASLFLWRNDPHTRRMFAASLKAAVDPAISGPDAETAIEWCARRAWCDLSQHRVAAAMKARGVIYKDQGKL